MEERKGILFFLTINKDCVLYNKSLRLHFFFLYFMDVGDRKSERHGRRKGRKKNSNLYDLTFLCFARLLSETFGPFFLFCNLHIRQKKFFLFCFYQSG